MDRPKVQEVQERNGNPIPLREVLGFREVRGNGERIEEDATVAAISTVAVCRRDLMEALIAGHAL